MKFEFSALNVQSVLGTVLRDPSRPLPGAIRAAIPSLPEEEVSAMDSTVRSCLQQVLKQARPDKVPAPRKHNAPVMDRDGLLDRLGFCWNLLKNADARVRGSDDHLLPKSTGSANLSKVFQGVLPHDVPLQPKFVTALAHALRIGEDGSHLGHYSAFLVASKRKTSKKWLSLSVMDAESRPISGNLRRLIWWILRSANGRYADELDPKPVARCLPYLVQHVSDELRRFCGVDHDFLDVAIDDIEAVVEEWLVYNCLRERQPAPGSFITHHPGRKLH